MGDQDIQRVAIIGGGAGGNEMLRVFTSSQQVTVAYVADTNPSAPAMLAAKHAGIKTYTNLENAVRNDPVDFYVEATNNPEVTTTINENKRKGEVISGNAAMMLYQVLDGQRKTINKQVYEDLTDVRREIEKNTRDVSKTLNGIEKISNELEVLAINAGIQASRAAHFGTGFAVVAGEVKSTARVARELAGDIDRIMSEIATMSNKIEQSLKSLK